MRRLIALAMVGVISGCSWQNTLHAVGETPGQLRLTDDIVIEDAPRWRLPVGAQVVVAGEEQVPQPWLDAANAGVAAIFGGARAADYVLRVQWPAVSDEPATATAGTETSYKAALFGVLAAPRIPAAPTLPVTLVDQHGTRIAQMHLRIRPQLWGSMWHEGPLLEASFMHLARTLRDG